MERRSCTLPTPVVFVVHDDASVRQALRSLLLSSGWQVEMFSEAGSFLSHVRVPGPTCVILGVDYPGIGGLELQAHLANRPDTPVIFVADRADARTAVKAMKAGAVEFLTGPIDAAALLEAIRQALMRSREALIQAEQMRSLGERYVLLSRREREVLELVIAGRLNKQAADALGISEITVKAHRGKVMRKMKARSVPDLVHMAAALRIGPVSADTWVSRM
jgi:FixJ family two-component response regulator